MQEREFHIDCSMTYGDMRRYTDTLDVTVCSDHLPTGIKGIYNESLRMIVIDRSLDYTQKRCTLVHELYHWAYFDNACAALSRRKSEIRTRRMTAKALVPTKRIALLSDEYEGDIALVANELNVTKQVLEDYQRLVLAI